VCLNLFRSGTSPVLDHPLLLQLTMIVRLKAFLLFVSLLLTSGCTVEPTKERSVVFGDEELSIKLMDGGTTVIPGINTGYWMGQEVVGYYNYFEHRIELYDLETQDSVLSIPIQQEGPNGVGNISTFYFFENKIAAYNANFFYLLDAKGNVLERSPWVRDNTDSSSIVKIYRLHYTYTNNNLSSHQSQDSFLYLNYVRWDESMSDPDYYTASEKVWALPNLFTRVYTRLEVVWNPKALRCRYTSKILTLLYDIAYAIIPLHLCLSPIPNKSSKT